MSDSSDIDNALVAALGADPALLALAPNGAYWEEAPPGATRFVIVSLVDEQDVATFGGRAYEDALYAVEYRGRGAVGQASAKPAAARLEALLEDLTLTVTGYAWMTLHRDGGRLRKTERDAADPAILWFRRGGHYRLQMALS